MFSAFLNSFKITELRQRILFTLGMIVVARIGANVPLPGINPLPLREYFDMLSQGGSNLVGMYNMFTGGALLKGAVFALGIMPYISASIILQLMGAVVPSLAKLQREGEIGRQKISQYTRYLTIAIALVQSLLLVTSLAYNPGTLLMGFDPSRFGSIVLISPMYFIVTGAVLLTAGTVMLMWIGEQMTQRGIGNGISLLITIGILADLPGAVTTLYSLVFHAADDAEAIISVPEAVFLLLVFIAVTAGIVIITQAVRKVPVQYAKRVVGRKVFGGQSSYMPLKVNYAGVMPVIFASALLMFPDMFLRTLAGWTQQDFFLDVASLMSPQGPWYYLVFGGMILGFSYFWVSIMFKPTEIADQLKSNGGYVPGVRPGEPTARFLDHIMTRLTLFGALSLTAIAIFPNLLSAGMGIPFNVAQFFGGTGTLIAVGVVLDTMRQVETFLLQRQYDGFLQKSKRRSRAKARTRQLIDPSELRSEGVMGLWVVCGSLLGVGIITWIIRQLIEI